MNPRDMVAMALTATICLILLSGVVSGLFMPGAVSETFRVESFKIIGFALGLVSGWLLAKETKQ